MRTTMARLPGLLLIALGLGACAPGPAPGEPGPVPDAADAVTITVQHDLPIAGSMAVSLVDPTGAPTLLGTVSPGLTETFEVPDDPIAGSYRLVGELPDGSSTVSPTFNLQAWEAVRWSVNMNQVMPSGD
jgi:hypothetical protein